MRIVLVVSLMIIVLIMMAGTVGYNDNGHIVAKQSFWFGNFSIKTNAGMFDKMWGDTWKFKKETSVKFTNDQKEKNVTTPAVFVRFNDGGTAYLSGAARFKMPLIKEMVFKVLRIFGNEKDLVNELYIPGVREICTGTAGLMSTDESYTTKRSKMSEWCSDQGQDGVYLIDIKDREITDDFGRSAKIPVYEIRTDTATKEILRKKPNLFGQFGIQNTQFEITSIEYLGGIKKNISDKMEFKTALQVTNSDIQKFEQTVNEVEATGKKEVTKAEMEERTKAMKVVQQMEGYRRTALTNISADSIQTVNALAATRHNVEAAIKEVEGTSAERSKSMAGDMALGKRLWAYDTVMTVWNEKISQRKENAPQMASNWDPMFFYNLLTQVEKQVRSDLGLNMNFGQNSK